MADNSSSMNAIVAVVAIIAILVIGYFAVQMIARNGNGAPASGVNLNLGGGDSTK